ncbi:hypothetical protein POM88_010668 [Heracleum sosnowskyi]|uniref:Uncharacterized protein n=1 Tax=Heracleum sosnowskyi TaxID=360622 RepID=A0AAD8IT29_9APIA|nr:hypothetical protein POM88_010668 [Heracleum sosnowskyi]
MGKKKGAKGESSKGKKARCANYTSKAPVDYDDDELLEEEEDEHPIFTYNNTPHFPTFKIELGEARIIIQWPIYNLDARNFTKLIINLSIHDKAIVHENKTSTFRDLYYIPVIEITRSCSVT